MRSSDLQILHATFDAARRDPHGFLVDVRRRALKRDSSLLHVLPAIDLARAALIVHTLESVLSTLDAGAAAPRAAEDLARRCRLFGIAPRHHGVLGQALLETLSARLGTGFTDAARSAWAEAYVLFAEALMAQSYNAMDLVA